MKRTKLNPENRAASNRAVSNVKRASETARPEMKKDEPKATFYRGARVR